LESAAIFVVRRVQIPLGSPSVIYARRDQKPGLPASTGETIDHVRNRDANRHPGIMRVMKVDSVFAGILVAVGFLVMGAVGLDIGRWFVLGALGLGVAVALLLRFTRKSG
jgi:hypothetical protein